MVGGSRTAAGSRASPDRVDSTPLTPAAPAAACGWRVPLGLNLWDFTPFPSPFPLPIRAGGIYSTDSIPPFFGGGGQVCVYVCVIVGGELSLK